MEADPPAGVTTLQKGPWNPSGCTFPGAAGGGADATSEEAPGVAAAGASGLAAGGAASGASGSAGADGTDDSFAAGDASALPAVTGSASRAAAVAVSIAAEAAGWTAEACALGLTVTVQYDALRVPTVAWTLTTPVPIAVTWPPMLMTATLWLLVPQAIAVLGS